MLNNKFKMSLENSQINFNGRTYTKIETININPESSPDYGHICKFKFPKINCCFAKNLKTNHQNVIEKIEFRMSGKLLFSTNYINKMQKILNTTNLPIPMFNDEPIPLVNNSEIIIKFKDDKTIITDDYNPYQSFTLSFDYFTIQNISNDELNFIFSSIYHNSVNNGTFFIIKTKTFSEFHIDDYQDVAGIDLSIDLIRFEKDIYLSIEFDDNYEEDTIIIHGCDYKKIDYNIYYLINPPHKRIEINKKYKGRIIIFSCLDNYLGYFNNSCCLIYQKN